MSVGVDGREAQITAAVAEITANRAVIEQAKGMLMLVYGVDAAAAFDLLRWQSQQYNVKLRAMAEQIASDFTAAAHRDAVDRGTYDNLLLTAHVRAAAPALRTRSDVDAPMEHARRHQHQTQ